MIEFAREVVGPMPNEETSNMPKRQRNLRRMFLGAIGELDETPIHAGVPVDQQARYRGKGREKYYLCDAAYANTRRFLTPYRNTRYLLADFRRRLALTKEERFNHAHAQLRNVIERAFGVLKARFPILKQMAPYPFRIQRNIVIACFAIHNFIRRCNMQYQLFMDYDNNPMLINEAQEQIDGGEEEEIDATPWGPQDSEYMTNLRNEIANQLVLNASN
ncbi:uncharacterized protein LOC112505983 [Cynara cardunculus var. scolymus]|uniref:uncharacterized protein LOC112505983 n=1 Tax=Cynara cardunculus var. scolymus TaxID=59895 RepID=UPI000D62DF0D|nr:uncharacterized protein LOC112505983 [Cynara cardunculus var. scolymus]